MTVIEAGCRKHNVNCITAGLTTTRGPLAFFLGCREHATFVPDISEVGRAT